MLWNNGYRQGTRGHSIGKHREGIEVVDRTTRRPTGALRGLLRGLVVAVLLDLSIAAIPIGLPTVLRRATPEAWHVGGAAYIALLVLAVPVLLSVDRRLAESEYLAGADYTVADIAVWPWYGGLAKGWLYEAAEFLGVQEYKNVQRWADMIGARPAVQRGRMVNRINGEPASQLHERHDAGDFATRTQDKLAAGH